MSSSSPPIRPSIRQLKRCAAAPSIISPSLLLPNKSASPYRGSKTISDSKTASSSWNRCSQTASRWLISRPRSRSCKSSMKPPRKPRPPQRHFSCSRKRHGKKRFGARAASQTARAATTRSSPSPAPAFRKSCWKANSFGHVRGAFTGAVGETWGKVKAAEGGTLFLDEIGELPPEIQPKLLRLLQEREYERVGDPKPRKANVRVIAATNRRLEDLVKEGKFREDLYYRLNVITIELPPLRQRALDISAMAQQLSQAVRAAESAAGEGVYPGGHGRDPSVIRGPVICGSSATSSNGRSSWLRGKRSDVNDFPDNLRGSQPSGAVIGNRVSLEELEREHILRIIEIASNMEEAAQILGIDPATSTASASATPRWPNRPRRLRPLPRLREKRPYQLRPCSHSPPAWAAVPAGHSCWRWASIPSTVAANWDSASRRSAAITTGPG